MLAASSLTVASAAKPLVLVAAPGVQRSIGLPVLAGAAIEDLLPGAVAAGTRAGFSLARANGMLTGVAAVSVAAAGGLEAATRALYHALFEASAGWHLNRVWNYVPAINAVGPDGLENYRAFCRGRSLAFEQAFGPAFKAHLPSASAVGVAGDELVLAFVSSTPAPRHLENPRQVPAYDYPAQYGPRPPSFARATVGGEPARPTLFISGTSAITGHATVAPFDTLGQLDCTLANLRTMFQACGVGGALGGHERFQRTGKVYLREAHDQPAVAARVERELARPGDTLSYVRADICRRELNVEIELTLRAL